MPARVGVVLHAYFADLLPELFDNIRSIPVGYDLIITNGTGARIEMPHDMGALQNLRVLDVGNRGRDIWPLVSLVNAGYLDPYHIILKVHTKRSAWRAAHSGLSGDGDRWRAQLLGALLGDGENVTQILDAFSEQPNLGLVSADGSILGPEFWGDNEDNVANLLRRIELRLSPDRLRFGAGSMYWIRGFALQGLRCLNLSADDFEPEEGQVNATTAHALERLLGVVIDEAGLAMVERSALHPSVSSASRRLEPGSAPMRPRARVVPFYLPQFHPVPENDRWWGKGFTEWTNVAAAKPMYVGQHQPKLPTDLGFYDLRLDDVRKQQSALATHAGIAGFMYYHYWFAGETLLEGPIEALLASDSDQPFCIMWANENWTRRWDGRQTDVLVAQDYDRVPAQEFIDSILPFLADKRYMTVRGRKILAVYRPGQIPDLASVIDAWRRRARDAGVGELHVLNVDVDVEFDGLEGTPEDHGIDGSLGFPPHNHHWHWVPHTSLGVDERFVGNILSYEAMCRDAERRFRRATPSEHYPGVLVGFDNTARRQLASDIWYGSNPYTFRRWLAAAVGSVMDRPADERVVFINAWNEWAEGAMLEPSDRFGRTFLLAVRDVALG
ncbi:MAG: glycoside hydrolase family 99-like domain-containing protein [Acidimicrobiales bacterium]